MTTQRNAARQREQTHRRRRGRPPTPLRPLREPAAPTAPKLLHSRKESAYLLDCSVAKLIRLENLGLLRGIKLDPSKPNGITYYAHTDLVVLASGR
jgi:hypothetical protein